MMVPLYWIWIAALGGAIVGILMICMFVASGTADDEIDAFMSRHGQDDEIAGQKEDF